MYAIRSYYGFQEAVEALNRAVTIDPRNYDAWFMSRITSYNVCYTKLLRLRIDDELASRMHAVIEVASPDDMER